MGFAKKRSYISWEDLKVEGEKLHGQNAGKNGVIVVDKNGKGDCLTVQAAVDMVPHHDEERLKIHILPGLYRFSMPSHLFNSFLRILFCGFSHTCMREFNVGSCLCSGLSTSTLSRF